MLDLSNLISNLRIKIKELLDPVSSLQGKDRLFATLEARAMFRLHHGRCCYGTLFDIEVRLLD